MRESEIEIVMKRLIFVGLRDCSISLSREDGCGRDWRTNLGLASSSRNSIFTFSGFQREGE